MRDFKKWLFRKNWLLGVLAYALLSGPAIYLYYKTYLKHTQRGRRQ